MKKHTNEDVIKFLADYEGFETTHTKIQSYAMKVGLIKPEFKKGKWYIDSDGNVCNYSSEDCQYGYISSSREWLKKCYWLNKNNLYATHSWKLATDKEVNSVLVKQWEKTNAPFAYYRFINGRLLGSADGQNEKVLFFDGVWGEIDEPKEVTIEDIQEKYGCKVKIVETKVS